MTRDVVGKKSSRPVETRLAGAGQKLLQRQMEAMGSTFKVRDLLRFSYCGHETHLFSSRCQ